jgi:hypothetical protein
LVAAPTPSPETNAAKTINASPMKTKKAATKTKKSFNTSGKASAQILHLPLGDDSSPSGDNAAGR